MRDAEQRLNMMADFVGNHVCLGEVAGRAEPGMKIFEKSKVQIDFPVRRTIKRPHGRVGHAAGGIDRFGK